MAQRIVPAGRNRLETLLGEKRQGRQCVHYAQSGALADQLLAGLGHLHGLARSDHLFGQCAEDYSGVRVLALRPYTAGNKQLVVHADRRRREGNHILFYELGHPNVLPA
jgi:hypothetical protein